LKAVPTKGNSVIKEGKIKLFGIRIVNCAPSSLGSPLFETFHSIKYTVKYSKKGEAANHFQHCQKKLRTEKE
jgi:hypothetical protein